MLADAGGKIGKVYGVYDEEAGVNIRGRFLIDPDGIIQGHGGSYSPSGQKCCGALPAGPSIPACPENRGGHSFWVATWEANPQTSP